MKNRSKKIIISCFIYSFLLLGCTSSNNTVIKEITSPDGKYTAFYFIRDLGATTKASYQLTILEKGEKLKNIEGNIFITYGEFDVQWEKNGELIVNVKKGEETFKEVTEYKEIKIKYQKQ